jgi:hypothetical protein
MKHFKLTPDSRIDILEQSLWLNKNITIKKKPIYWKSWQNKGIHTLSNLLDHENKFLSHIDINRLYNASFSYLQVEQIKSCIPKIWKKELKGKHNIEPNNCQVINICINNHYKNIQFVKCKDFYWHLLNLTEHTPASKKKWAKIFQSLINPEETVWTSIYKMPFKTVRDTKLQTLQYRIIHRIIPCKEWLYNIKKIDYNICDFCEKKDDISHFFITCPINRIFWKSWSKWWNSLSDTDISSCTNIEECILFGFSGNDDLISALNYIILIAKEYIYLTRLKKNKNIDFLSYLSILKNKLTIEKMICDQKKEYHKFNKFLFIFDNI